MENNNNQQQHHRHRDYREYEKKRQAERRKRWRRRRAISFLINAGLVLGAVGLIFLFDYLVGLQEEIPVEPTNKVEQQQTENIEEEVEKAAYKIALPEKSYAFAGEPITYYFLNLIGYNDAEGVEYEVNTGGKGKVYEDRWEYTPEKAETITFEFKARAKNGKIISEGKSVIEVREKSEKEELTVLMIGDSTIEAGYESQKLLNLAEEDGYSLKLLGKVTATYLQDPNNRYEGRGGWRAAHYASSRFVGTQQNPFYNPTSREFDFAYYMENQWYTEVDCVVLQLGINDILGATTDSELAENFIPKYLKYMDTIIEGIHKYDPNIKIVWNLVFPGSTDESKFSVYSGAQSAERYKRNSYLTNLEVIEHVAGMENVYVAPIHAALDVNNDMAGSSHGAVHPASRGYHKLGNQLYGFLRAIN